MDEICFLLVKMQEGVAEGGELELEGTKFGEEG